MATAHRSNLGELIKALREQRGMSQAELAIAAGVAINTVCGIEQKRRHDPPWSILQRLAYGLGVTPNELATLTQRELVRPTARSGQKQPHPA